MIRPVFLAAGVLAAVAACEATPSAPPASLDPREPEVAAEAPVEPSTVTSDEGGAPSVADACATPPALPATFANPVSPKCADPGILKVEGACAGDVTFFVGCTGTSGGGALPMFRSKDLATWQPAGAVFPQGKVPAWSNKQWWAPELHKVGNRYLAYYSAQPTKAFQLGDTDYFCLGVASSDKPEGPYEDIGKPLLCNKSVSLIDATFFHDDASKRNILYYKTNFAAQGKDATIDAIQLSDDGLAIDGTPRTILTVTLPFETGNSVEGPWMVKHGAYYFLFYSAGIFNKDYSVGVARSLFPTKDFEKRSSPILKGNSKFLAPGHNSFVTYRDADWLVYHAYPDELQNGRSLLIDKITWTNDWPIIGTGTPSGGGSFQ